MMDAFERVHHEQTRRRIEWAVEMMTRGEIESRQHLVHEIAAVEKLLGFLTGFDEARRQDGVPEAIHAAELRSWTRQKYRYAAQV